MPNYKGVAEVKVSIPIGILMVVLPIIILKKQRTEERKTFVWRSK